jgi:hypothetical protein
MHFGNYNTLRLVTNSNKHNAIIEIKIQDDDSFCIKQVRKYSMQQQSPPDGNTSIMLLNLLSKCYKAKEIGEEFICQQQ